MLAKFSVTRVCSSLKLCQNIGTFVPIKVQLKYSKYRSIILITTVL